MIRRPWTSRSSSSAAALCAALLLAGAPTQAAPPKAPPAPPAPPGQVDDFNTHYRRALELYRARDFAGSERELLLAYQLRPLPALLLNLGHAHLDQGHGEKALELYGRYLQAEPNLSEAQRADVARYQDQARRLLPASAPPSSPWRRPLGQAGVGLSAAGAALLLLGAGLGGAALAAADEVVTGSGPFDQDLDQRGRALSQAAIACDVLGGVALATGAVLTIVNLVRARRERPAPLAHGAAAPALPLVLLGRF